MKKPEEDFESERVITFNRSDDDSRPAFFLNNSESPIRNNVITNPQNQGTILRPANNNVDSVVSNGIFNYFLHNESHYVQTEPNAISENHNSPTNQVRNQNREALNDSNLRVERMIHGYNQAQNRRHHGEGGRHNQNGNNEDEYEEDSHREGEEDDEDDDLEVGELLKEILYVTLMFQGFFLLIIAYFYTTVPYALIFGYMWAIDIRTLLSFVQRLKKRKTQGKKFKKLWLLPLIDIFVHIIYKVMLLISLRLGYLRTTHSFILLFVLLISKSLIMCYQKYYYSKSIITESLEYAFRFFIYLQICMISLKMDDLIDWDWKDVFWTYWVFFSIMIGVSLGFFIIVLGKFYQSCIEKVESYELKGLTWLLLISIGITINSAICVNTIIDSITNDDPTGLSALLYIGCYVMVVCSYTYFTRLALKTFLDKVAEDEEGEEGENADQYLEDHVENPTEKKEKRPRKLKIEKNPSKHFFPQFLSKYSSTYFKQVNSSFNTQNKSPTKKKKIDPKAKTKKYQLKSNSFILPSSYSDNHIEDYNSKNYISVKDSTNQNLLFSTNNRNETTETEEDVRKSIQNKLLNSPNFRTSSMMFGPDKLNNKIENKTSISKPIAEERENHFQAPRFRLELDKNIPQKSNPPKDITSQLNVHFGATTSVQYWEPVKISENYKKNKRERNRSMPTFNRSFTAKSEKDLKLETSVVHDQSVVIDGKNENSVSSCLICFENSPNAVYMDCGHGGVCYECAVEIFQKTGECYLCRKEIKQVLKLDLESKQGNILKVISSVRAVQPDENVSHMDISQIN